MAAVTGEESLVGGTSSNLLQTFWGLSSLEEQERLQAAKELLSSLKERQQGESLHSEVEYAVQRLVRGLASSRKGARQGYYVALTELLSMFNEVPLSRVFQLIHMYLEVTGSAKAQEERGAYFGRVFALLALVQSGRLTEMSDVAEVVKQLGVCGQRKSYLREFCAVVTGDLVERCGEEVVRECIVPGVEGVGKGWEGCTPETLYLLLLLEHRYGKCEWFKVLMKTHWGGHKHVTSHSSYQHMAAVLPESSSAHPRLHSVWPLVISAVRHRGHFGTFWKIVVDDALFVSSHERKYLGFKLLETLLPALTASEVSIVFSPNLLRCLVNNAYSRDNYLHAAAKHLLTEISNHIEVATDPSVPITLLLHLQARTGGRFDQLTDTKITDNILAKLDADGIQQLVLKLQDIFCHPTPITSIADSEEGLSDIYSVQLWVIDQVLSLVRNGKLPRSGPWLLTAARFLFLHAFFSVKKPNPDIPELAQVPSVPVEKVVHEACAQRFFSVLSDISTIVLREKKGGVWKFGQPGVMEGGRFFLAAVVQFARQLLAAKKYVVPLEAFQDETLKAWDAVCEMVEDLSETEAGYQEERAFLLLLSTAGLQLFSEQSDKTTEVVQELKACHEEMRVSRSTTPCKKTHKEAEGKGVGWVEVLTDTLLGLLSRPSLLWRGVVNQAFRMVTHHVTRTALGLVLQVLEPENKEDLMVMEGEEEEDEEEEQEQEDEEDEDEGEDGEEKKEEEGEEEDEEGSSGSSGEDEEGEGVDPAFRAEIKKALGPAAVCSDDDEESMSESSLDDDAMMAVDEALAAAFRSRFTSKHQNRQKKDDEKSIIHFKLRALDLIEVYTRKESANPLVLDLVLPLYKLIHDSHGRKGSTPLVERSKGVYSNKLCHMKEYPRDGVDGDHVHRDLHTLLQCLYKADARTTSLVSQGCMFLLRVLRGCSAPPVISPLTTRSGRKRKLQEDPTKSEPPPGLLNVPLVTGWFSDALHHFITVKNSSVHQSFFTTYIERYPVLAWLLVPKMVEDLPAAANHFRKVQVYEMLSLLLSQRVEDKTLCDHLPGVASQLQSHCAGELSSCAGRDNPAKLLRPLLRMILKLVATLRSKEELSHLLDAGLLLPPLHPLTSHPSLGADIREECRRVTDAITGEVAMATNKRRKRSKHRRKRANSKQ